MATAVLKIFLLIKSGRVRKIIIKNLMIKKRLKVAIRRVVAKYQVRTKGNQIRIY